MHDHYFEDRMYVLEVAYVTTRSLTRCEPEKQEWAVITRRNVPGYLPCRCDSFPTREDALAYARSVEPSTPRVGLNGHPPNLRLLTKNT
jgi:hypothetical protein